MAFDKWEYCPWCKIQTGLMILDDKDQSNKRFYQVCCFECGSSGPAARTQQAALNKWNKR